jgi:hypothetical protein
VQGHVDQAPLLQQDGLKRSYGATQSSISSDIPDFNPSKKRINQWRVAIAAVLTVGVLMIISFLVVHMVIPNLLDDIANDQINLGKYEPSLFNNKVKGN